MNSQKWLIALLMTFAQKLCSLVVDVKAILLIFINLNQKSKYAQEVRDPTLVISKAFWIIDVVSSCETMATVI